ncbi:hypothetical protein Bbelb_240260 [Branchiostoma belcheri]|nr:hypothetical protein Bbelb_240260 [Branchiostoma belcheri]
MKLFVCTLLVTMVVVAMLADDAEAFGPRRRSGSAKLTSSLKAEELREVVEEARSLLDDLEETQQLDARERQEAALTPVTCSLPPDNPRTGVFSGVCKRASEAAFSSLKAELRFHSLPLNSSREEERAMSASRVFQSEIVRGKKEFCP